MGLAARPEFGPAPAEEILVRRFKLHPKRNVCYKQFGNSVAVKMVIKRLLKSCAIPPANRPIASILDD